MIQERHQYWKQTLESLKAKLEQWDGEIWSTNAFASRFSNTHEIKYSKNEQEFLGMVWATEHSKNYLYGAEFEEQFEDHRALLSALNGNQSNKTMNSRLSRWVNSRRLLPFVSNQEFVSNRTTLMYYEVNFRGAANLLRYYHLMTI